MGPYRLKPPSVQSGRCASFFDPVPVDDTFDAYHKYEYTVTGTGQKAAFKINDNNGDNHGILRITVVEPSN